MTSGGWTAARTPGLPTTTTRADLLSSASDPEGKTAGAFAGHDGATSPLGFAAPS
jgi:hypothetical protein